MHNICKTAISGEEQNLYKQMAEFRISILFQYFIHILAKFNTFKVLKPDFTSQYFFNSIPRGNPVFSRNNRRQGKAWLKTQTPSHIFIVECWRGLRVCTTFEYFPENNFLQRFGKSKRLRFAHLNILLAAAVSRNAALRRFGQQLTSKNVNQVLGICRHISNMELLHQLHELTISVECKYCQ